LALVASPNSVINFCGSKILWVYLQTPSQRRMYLVKVIKQTSAN
jgi:hypothetical protein